MLKLLVLVSLFYSNSASHMPVPVFLLDHGKALANFIEPPLAVITTSQFKKIAKQVTETCKVVLIFVEDEFCMENVTTKSKMGTPYIHLRKGIRDKNITFIPSILDPLKTLSYYFPYTENEVRYLTEADVGKEFTMPHDKALVFYSYFYFKGTLTGSTSLELHDRLINKIYDAIREDSTGPTVAFYTGKTNPVIDTKMETDVILTEEEKLTDNIFSSYGGLFRLKGVYTTAGTRRAMFDYRPRVSGEEWEINRLSTRMSYTDFEVEFHFSLMNNNWNIDYVALLEGGEEVGRTLIDAKVPWGSSYVCGVPLVLVNTRDASSVIISQYQLQPFRRALPVEGYDEGADFVDPDTAGGTEASSGSGSGDGDDGDDRKFGVGVHCSPCFTSSILAGLFVTLLCSGILAVGSIALYNVKSNDKFDDPSMTMEVEDDEGQK